MCLGIDFQHICLVKPFSFAWGAWGVDFVNFFALGFALGGFAWGCDEGVLCRYFSQQPLRYMATTQIHAHTPIIEGKNLYEYSPFPAPYLSPRINVLTYLEGIIKSFSYNLSRSRTNYLPYILGPYILDLKNKR